MNNPDNNPYQDSGPSPSPKADADKGSLWLGFFVGWGLMIGSSLLAGIVISIISRFESGFGNYDSSVFQLVGLLASLVPIASVVAGMIWFGKKGKSKTVLGIAAAIGSIVALVLLLVAACFGMIAMEGRSGWH